MKVLIYFALFSLLGCEESKTPAPICQDVNSIHYTRYDFRHPEVQTTSDLLTLVYDIPYFGACGVLPPLHIMNQIFSSGGGDGGMSPGSSWKPFRISPTQYHNLLQQVRETPVIRIQERARFGQLKFITDSSFDEYMDRGTWLKKVCEKYREGYLREMNKILEGDKKM